MSLGKFSGSISNLRRVEVGVNRRNRFNFSFGSGIGGKFLNNINFRVCMGDFFDLDTNERFFN